MSNIIDKLTSGILVVDEALVIYEWNSWLTIHTKISRDDALGKRLNEIFDYIDSQTLQGCIKTSIMLDTSTFYEPNDGYLIRIENKKVTDSFFEYMRQSIKLVPIGNKRVLIIINDHTSIYEAMHKMEMANKKSSSYLGVIDRYVYTAEIDKFGYIIDASTAFCRLNGVEKEILIGKSWLAFFSPEVGIETINSFKMAIEHNGVCFSGEVKMKLLNKKESWFKLSIFSTEEFAKSTNSFQAILEDVTAKKRIEELSITDDLTKLYNRRYFNEVFAKELNRAKREKKQFTFMVMDVDNFKLYNDHYGHLKGDKALIEVSNVLKNTLKRGGDFVFRLGGEEFGAIVAIDMRGSEYSVCERVRAAIQELNIEHVKNAKHKILTVSIGISSVDFMDESKQGVQMDDIYKLADEALYAAKNGGRNRVVVYKIGEKNQ